MLFAYIVYSLAIPGKGWVGWKSETKNASDPVEIIFKFDSVREFSSLHIHSSNQFTKEVQVRKKNWASLICHHNELRFLSLITLAYLQMHTSHVCGTYFVLS
jgi:hypothetical protein